MNLGVILTVFVFVAVVCCDNTNQELLSTYDNYITVSLDLDRSDRSTLQQWGDSFQLNQINVTTQYRLIMRRHIERSFRKVVDNAKWNQCIKLYRTEINKNENWYYDNESECLKVANAAGQVEVKANEQLGKEIKRWRKGYKYLKNLCESEHGAGGEAFSNCVVEYVQKDKYDEVYQRLILLKLDAMNNILVQQNQAVYYLEKCLNTILSEYITKIRTLKRIVDNCYDGNKT